MVIKTVVKQNPLADCGNIVTGNRFIGREHDIETIQNRILVKNGGNIAIMGLPRVGKSSLVWKALVEQREEALKNKIFIIRINVGNISKSEDFYKMLVSQLFDDLEDEEILTDKKLDLLIKYKNMIFNQDIDNTDKENSIWRFYKIIAREDIHIIYVLDEFDHIGTIFKLENFQLLRELSINPDTNIALSTISRRTINEIELLGDAALSKLSAVFSDLNLGLFNKDEVALYWKYLSSIGIETDKEYQDIVKYYAGYHPFLIDMFNFEMINGLLISTTYNIEKFIDSEMKLKIYNQYDYIVSTLKEENLYSQIMSILFGMDYSVNVKSIERLEKLGMIYKNEKNKYKCFSNYFKNYIYEKLDNPLLTKENKIFLSYQSSTNDLATKVECAVIDNLEGVELLRDRKDLNYKDSIEDFMKQIHLCKYVIMIVSDEFLESRYCMKEAMMLFEDINFKQKIIPLIVSDNIYDGKNTLNYVLYWENEKKVLQNQINLVHDNSRTTRAQQELVEIDNILRFLDSFIEYVENAYVKNIKEHINENFITIINEMKKTIE